MPDASTQSSTLGLISTFLGAIAFAILVGLFFAGPIDPPPPLETSIAEKAASIRDATVAALKGEAYEAPPVVRQRTIDDYVTYGCIAAGVLAILLAVAGFIRKESWRPLVAGAALGGLAITFQFAVVVFFALLFALILGTVLDQLDFSF